MINDFFKKKTNNAKKKFFTRISPLKQNGNLQGNLWKRHSPILSFEYVIFVWKTTYSKLKIKGKYFHGFLSSFISFFLINFIFFSGYRTNYMYHLQWKTIFYCIYILHIKFYIIYQTMISLYPQLYIYVYVCACVHTRVRIYITYIHKNK